jgi:hypothetical protein
MSFTKFVRETIKERAEGRSELSNENSRPLVCAHLNHRGKKGSKKKSKIDCPKNGLLVTDIEHYGHHFIFRSNPKLIGLSQEQNEISLISIRRDIFKEGDITEDEFYEKLSRAISVWEGFYEESLSNTESITSLLSAVQRG